MTSFRSERAKHTFPSYPFVEGLNHLIFYKVIDIYIPFMIKEAPLTHIPTNVKFQLLPEGQIFSPFVEETRDATVWGWESMFESWLMRCNLYNFDKLRPIHLTGKAEGAISDRPRVGARARPRPGLGLASWSWLSITSISISTRQTPNDNILQRSNSTLLVGIIRVIVEKVLYHWLNQTKKYPKSPNSKSHLSNTKSWGRMYSCYWLLWLLELLKRTGLTQVNRRFVKILCLCSASVRWARKREHRPLGSTFITEQQIKGSRVAVESWKGYNNISTATPQTQSCMSRFCCGWAHGPTPTYVVRLACAWVSVSLHARRCVMTLPGRVRAFRSREVKWKKIGGQLLGGKAGGQIDAMGWEAYAVY